MKIVDRLSGKDPVFSFEFFPPKNQEGMTRLFEAISELAPFEPGYVSVTYGAGGSTRDLTVDLVRRIKGELGIEAMAHLTCVGATQEELYRVLSELKQAGIENVLPLRGDPPQGQAEFARVPGGFAHASELAAFAREHFDFCLAGACYPEVHPEAVSLEADLLHLRKKVDAGVEWLITQLFFDCADYFRFTDSARKAGITVPIVAGIMPITNVDQIKRFTQMCGAKIPEGLLRKLENSDQDPATIRALGVDHATEQCRELLSRGAPGIHFYTLNRSLSTRQVLDRLRAG